MKDNKQEHCEHSFKFVEFINYFGEWESCYECEKCNKPISCLEYHLYYEKSEPKEENVEKRLKVINLFAGPGAGKSTIAAGVFHKLKLLGINCELVTEYAKDKVWEKHFSVFDDSVYILAKQFHRLFRLDNQVEVVVTDSPLLLTLYYNTRGFARKGKIKEKLDELTIELANMFDNYNFFISRLKAYNPKGRMETEDEAKVIDRELREILTKKKIKFTNLSGDCSKSVEDIVKFVKEEIKWQRQ